MNVYGAILAKRAMSCFSSPVSAVYAWNAWDHDPPFGEENGCILWLGLSYGSPSNKFANLSCSSLLLLNLLQVTAYFKSKTVSRELPKGLNSLGIALCLRRSSSGISSAAFKYQPLRNSLIHRVCLLINKECRKLEKKSLLQKTTVSDLKHFKWNSVLKEWKKEPPTF